MKDLAMSQRNDMTTQSEQTLEEIKKLLDYLGRRLFHIENFYLIYSELGLHHNKKVSEESSKAYHEIIKSHKGFFIPAQEALRATFTVELNTFIISRDFRSLRRVIELLKEVDGGVDLTTDYSNLKTKNANVLEHIKGYRNKYYAHKTNSNIAKLKPTSDKELQELFEDTKNLFNEAYAHFGHSVGYMEGELRESIKDTHSLMNSLLQGEAQELSKTVQHISNTYHDGRKKWMEL